MARRFVGLVVSVFFGVYGAPAFSQVLQCICELDPSFPVENAEIVSRNSAGEQDTRVHSSESSISADGRYVVFTSQSGFFAGTAERYEPSQIFIKDLTTGELRLVSQGVDGLVGDAESFEPIVSATGRYVAFYSRATNLTAVDVDPSDNLNVRKHLYVWDSQTEEIFLITQNDQNEASTGDAVPGLSFSPDETKLVFAVTRGNMFDDPISGPNTGIFISTIGTGLLTEVQPSVVQGAPAGEPAGIDEPDFSSDGTKLVYMYGGQAVVHDLISNIATVVSTTAAGELAVGTVENPQFGANDNLVMFESVARNLAPDDYDVDYNDVFVKNLSTGELELVSILSSGVPIDDDVRIASFSPDGTRVAMIVSATRVVDGDIATGFQIFIHNRMTGQTEIVARSYNGSAVTRSGYMTRYIFSDDNTVTFMTRANNIDPTDASSSKDDIFVRSLVGQCIP